MSDAPNDDPVFMNVAMMVTALIKVETRRTQTSVDFECTPVIKPSIKPATVVFSIGDSASTMSTSAAKRLVEIVQVAILEKLAKSHREALSGDDTRASTSSLN